VKGYLFGSKTTVEDNPSVKHIQKFIDLKHL